LYLTNHPTSQDAFRWVPSCKNELTFARTCISFSLIHSLPITNVMAAENILHVATMQGRMAFPISSVYNPPSAALPAREGVQSEMFCTSCIDTIFNDDIHRLWQILAEGRALLMIRNARQAVASPDGEEQGRKCQWCEFIFDEIEKWQSEEGRITRHGSEYGKDKQEQQEQGATAVQAVKNEEADAKEPLPESLGMDSEHAAPTYVILIGSASEPSPLGLDGIKVAFEVVAYEVTVVNAEGVINNLAGPIGGTLATIEMKLEPGEGKMRNASSW
jgi:hypothetical protein